MAHAGETATTTRRVAVNYFLRGIRDETEISRLCRKCIKKKKERKKKSFSPFSPRRYTDGGDLVTLDLPEMQRDSRSKAGVARAISRPVHR